MACLSYIFNFIHYFNQFISRLTFCSKIINAVRFDAMKFRSYLYLLGELFKNEMYEGSYRQIC